MGFERDDEDPHRGRGSTPKLRLAGQIDGVVDGRPVSLVAERQDLVLTVERWRTLLTIRRSSQLLIPSLREFLTRSDIRLFVRVRWLGRVEVHPKQSFLVRMLLPLE
jgi:hypothetical protein